MNGLNECKFIGRLGQDPESRTLNNGDMVTNISLAIGNKYKDKTTGQQVESTEWVRVVGFKRTAEIMSQYLKKGSLVYISGAMKTRKYTDNNGVEKYSTEIVANDLKMLDSRGDNPAPQQQAPQQQQQQAQSYQGAQQGTSKQAQPSGFDDFDDSIPF